MKEEKKNLKKKKKNKKKIKTLSPLIVKRRVKYLLAQPSLNLAGGRLHAQPSPNLAGGR